MLCRHYNNKYEVVVSIEADPALGVPYGNDLQFPGVFGKWYLFIVPEGHFCILELV